MRCGPHPHLARRHVDGRGFLRHEIGSEHGVATLFYPAVGPAHHLREAHNDYLHLGAEGGC